MQSDVFIYMHMCHHTLFLFIPCALFSIDEYSSLRSIFLYIFKLFWIGILIPFSYGQISVLAIRSFRSRGSLGTSGPTPSLYGGMWNMSSSYLEDFSGWRWESLFFVYCWVEMTLNYWISTDYFFSLFKNIRLLKSQSVLVTRTCTLS